MSESESDDTGVQGFPESAVRKTLSIESQIRVFLDKCLELKIGQEYNALREKIRNFSEETGDYTQVFAIIVLCIRGPEGFFSDTETELGEEKADRLRKFGEDYSELEADIQAVYNERLHNKHNPVDSYAWDFKIKSETPVIKLREKSGSLRVLEVHDNIEEVLKLGQTKTETVSSAMEELAEEDITLDEEIYDSLNETINKIDEDIDHIKRNIGENSQGEE